MKDGQNRVIAVTCALIIDKRNRVFAAQRSAQMSLPLKWELPGGKIEINETPKQCLIREIEEELGVEVTSLVALPSNIHTYPTMIVELIPFICQIKRGEISLKEHINLKWLNPDQLLDLDWADADIPILKHYLNHINANN